MSADMPVLIFVLSALALTVAMTLLILLPVLRSRDAQHSLLELNVQVFRERLAELEEDKTAGRVDQTTFEALKTELQRQLLTLQADAPAAAAESRLGRKGAFAFLLAIPLLAGGAYAVLAFKPEVFTWWKVQLHTGPFVDKLFAGEQPTPEDMQTQSLPDMVRVMQTRLQKHPESTNGWFMLGMSYMQGDLADQALEAFDQAWRLSPERDDVAMAYAQTLLFTRQGKLDDQSRMLLQGVLDRHPQHEGALLLMGMGAYRAGDLKTALTYLPVLKQVHIARTGETNSAAIAEVDKVIALARSGGEKVATGGGVQVTVKLADNLKARVPANATLFIFARALNGPPMPLAVVRQPVGSFPVTAVLNDSQAMMPSMKLSAFPSVVVSARISASGNPVGEKGDLEAIAVPLTQNGKMQTVDVLINQERP
ncbi:cytochrome c-type biogenesis protein CcmI [Fluviicoccus keumensis]|uniref:Cytochrome c-type biogenesis protein CcmI n=2 Tax=Fluviicoccus keumensis TaxID=1435465 RepID=A0A4Q7YHW5_9GAMM|nr:cytochrome c-type biogenesis protein CcmI [Fluviicoccus keumensis]